MAKLECRFFEKRIDFGRRSSRRSGNNSIRGPQSALTDFLASHNISAHQIRQDYDQRRRAAQQDAGDEETANPGLGGPGSVEADGVVQSVNEAARDETTEQKRKRKRKEEAAIAKIKKSKEYQKRKLNLAGRPDENDDEGLAWDMYSKSKPLPGQLENCDVCEKRFTVTAYSKTGPSGGLLCPKCSKEFEAEKKEAKARKPVLGREKRRKVQSNLLDGLIPHGAKTLKELCIERVADNINDVEEFGDLPPGLLDRLSQILSKRRVLTPRTLDLFLRTDLDSIAIYDCGKLGAGDYIKIFSIIPKAERLDLRNAGQFKDEVIDYIIERRVPLRSIRLDASNLISDEKWREFFDKAGQKLEALELSWLDFAMDDDTVLHLVQGCSNLKRLTLKKCFRIGDSALQYISRLQNLEHLRLCFMSSVSNDNLTGLVYSIGHNLRTLSLQRFHDADEGLLEAIHLSCGKLTKLCITDNDTCADAAYAALFTQWKNPALSYVKLSSNRDIDNNMPDGPEEAVGLASAGFKALMAHSGSKLESLNIRSCRHISREALGEVFDGIKKYPLLELVDVSFVSRLDTVTMTGLFRSCPSLTKVAAFGCFDVKDVVVPTGVALIGVPTAQDSIVQRSVWF